MKGLTFLTDFFPLKTFPLNLREMVQKATNNNEIKSCRNDMLMYLKKKQQEGNLGN